MGVHVSRGSEIANLTSFLSACPFPKKIETLMIFLLEWRSIFKRAVCVPSPPPEKGGGGKGTQQSFRMGGSARDSTPHPFMTFLTENVPLSYTYLPGSLSTAVNSLPLMAILALLCHILTRL